jgi:hypothetical protein
MRTMLRLRSRRSRAARPALLGCPACGADALCPIEWQTFGDEHWDMWMRCGACGGWLEALVDNRAAAAMDVELDRQQALIRAAADALELERMAAEVETFVSALERDLVDAADFAR